MEFTSSPKTCKFECDISKTIRGRVIWLVMFLEQQILHQNNPKLRLYLAPFLSQSWKFCLEYLKKGSVDLNEILWINKTLEALQNATSYRSHFENKLR